MFAGKTVAVIMPAYPLWFGLPESYGDLTSGADEFYKIAVVPVGYKNGAVNG